MQTFGLIGYPLGHSFSQSYFTEKFKKENIDARYLNFPIPEINELPDLLKKHPYLAGLNVTIPYKQQVIDYLDELDPQAKDIGAVNVIKITWKNKVPYLKGYNSDVIGFSRSITPLLKPLHTKALILGTGGASKAVAYALKQLGLLFRFVSRNPQHPSHVSYQALTPEIIKEYKVIINTTPLGMAPNTDVAPPIPYEGITQEHLAFDLIYNPETTLFLNKCANKGAVIKNGLEMLHLQAEAAWEIFNQA
ncbi:shikimate dehydrogenase family protein [Thermophagus xiamenensis]|uniref:Shikimate dehydrogenase n=1 Tax=Thermophagus xiamenensis TaxID=385682 RepID=A0A1I2B1U6_9BACT|nr:shikimate dehydrogenase [Thermophagus xiamenensis]SFE50171.1 shikimate dehydrogenase [Thermophagus xiamenensis]